MADVEGDADKEKSVNPITSSEVLDRISSGDFVGRNTWKRGLIGDVEELMGWHSNDISSIPLNQQGRIGILRQIIDAAEVHKESPEAERVSKWAKEREVDIMTDEADRYLKERATTEKLQETPDVVNVVKELEELSKPNNDSDFTWTSNRVMQDTGYEQYEKKADKWEMIKQKKIELYKLVYEK